LTFPEDRLDGGFAYGVGSRSVFSGETFDHGPAHRDRVGTAAAVASHLRTVVVDTPISTAAAFDRDLGTVEAFDDSCASSDPGIIRVGDAPGHGHRGDQDIGIDIECGVIDAPGAGIARGGA
jgi:hypothetical protein